MSKTFNCILGQSIVVLAVQKSSVKKVQEVWGLQWVLGRGWMNQGALGIGVGVALCAISEVILVSSGEGMVGLWGSGVWE